MLNLNFNLIIALLVAITVHEFAHAYSAYKMGDPTAKLAGRMTLNPLPHLDLLGTLLLFFVGFGWGKPVPVDYRNFRNPRLGAVVTAVSGPLANLIVAAIFYIPLKHWLFGTPLAGLFAAIVQLNIILLIFNLIPLAPLDGSHFVTSILSRFNPHMAYQFVRYSPIVLFSIILLEHVLNFPLLIKLIIFLEEYLLLLFNLLL